MSLPGLPEVNQQIGTLVYCGTGPISALEEVMACKAKRVVLVHADERVTAELALGARKDPRLEILTGVLSSAAGATLKRYNFAELNSIRTPTGLKDLFPGLRALDSVAVPILSADVLAKSLPEDESNWLVVQSPGDESVQLRLLNDAGLLQRFETIVVQTARGRLFDGATGMDALERWLTTVYFSTGRQQLGDDPERPFLRLSINRLGRDIDALRAEKDQLEALLQETIRSAESRETNLKAVALDREAELQAMLQKQKADLEDRGAHQLAKAQQKADERIAELEALATSHEAALHTARQTLATQDKTVAGLKSDLQAANRVCEDHARALETLRGEIGELKATLSKRDGEVASLHKAMHEAEIEAATRLSTTTKALETDRGALARAQAEIKALTDKHAADLKALKARNDKVLADGRREAETQNLRHREELSMAEGQIEMLKELLLQNPDL